MTGEQPETIRKEEEFESIIRELPADSIKLIEKTARILMLVENEENNAD